VSEKCLTAKAKDGTIAFAFPLPLLPLLPPCWCGNLGSNGNNNNGTSVHKLQGV
jgi:hypothetical protein